MRAFSNVQYPLAFTTLACPDWSWEQIVQKAVEYGYQGVELRGVEGEMDLTKAAPFTSSRLAATIQELKDLDVTIPCLDTSCRFDQSSQIPGSIDEGKRHIDLAAALGASYIRIFGDRIADQQQRERIIAQVAEGLLALARYAAGTDVQILLESHGDFAHSQNLLDVLHVVHHPQVAVLWDVHHPFKFFSEPLAETYEKLKEHIRHIHLKSSIHTNGGIRYALMSQGDMPVFDVLQLLRSSGYGGWISFEWEKRWHPEIEEPEVALPDFIHVMQQAEVRFQERT